jgi:HD-GYP domain-containing protein (c-di-GMP phosphodiesterase class II)
MSPDDRFIDSIKQAYFLFARRLDGTIISVSPTAKTLLGYNRDEFIELCRTSLPLSSLPSDTAGSEIYMPPYEVQINHKDSTPRWLKITEMPIVNQDGDITEIECLAQDITGHKLLEIDLRNSEKDMREVLSGTIRALAMTVEARDYFSFGHHQRASSFARIISQELGMSSDTTDTIRMAAIIHDIGKICIPPEILNKRNTLSETEFSFIQNHPETGYNIIKDIDLPEPLADIVLQHHERINGSGYPRRLIADEILPETKIMMVADVMEAMASDRAHRPALNKHSIVEELNEKKNILYDADVVNTSINLINAKKIVF